MSTNLLAGVPLFATVPRDELDRLAQALQPRQAPAGTVLFNEGECGEHFYVVVSGRVEVIKALGTPEEVVLGERSAGQFVGEMSLINRDGRRTATVRVAEAASLLEMHRADFDALLQRYPALGYEMVQLLSTRLTEHENHAIADLREKNAQLQAAYDSLRAAQAQIIEKERLDRELQLAHDIQMGILPQVLPKAAGYSFGAQARPARAVGGDLYDFILVDERTVSMVVGDVAGKGMPAAIFMAQTLALLRAECRREASPAEVLRRVNQLLLHLNRAELFVTALLARLDLDTGRIVYARAGHEAPLLAAGGPAVTLPRSRGQPLAILEDVELDEAVVELPPGSTLLIYTDGMSDVLAPDGETYGAARLREAMGWEAAEGGDAQALCDRLLARVTAFQGGAAQYDDMTVVAVVRG
jgi:serine phosphatase RsbU (regulator of sigma subunit)